MKQTTHLAQVDDFAGDFIDDIAVTLARHRTLVKSHYVLRQRPGLVGKYVLYLAQLFV